MGWRIGEWSAALLHVARRAQSLSLVFLDVVCTGWVCLLACTVLGLRFAIGESEGYLEVTELPRVLPGIVPCLELSPLVPEGRNPQGHRRDSVRLCNPAFVLSTVPHWIRRPSG